MIDAFKELIAEDRIAGDVVLCASVSSADLIGFIDSEEERWNQAQRRARPAAAAMAATATGTAAAAAPEPFVSELLPSGVRAPTTPGELLPLLSLVLPRYLRRVLSLHDLESVDVLLLEPPAVNLNAEKVPDASFAWMGGVDSALTVTEDGFVDFAAQWFEQLERAQRAGLIKSYGLSSARVTMMPYAAQLAPEAAKAAAASSSGLPPAPAAPHGSKFYVPLQRIIDAARAASAKVGPAADADAAAGQGTAAKEHNLSTLKFPFSLFNAHKLLYPPPGHSDPSFFDQSRAAGLLCLGDLPLDDSEPRFNEWIRFQECPSQDSKNLLKHYRESMQKITNLEYVYKRQWTDSARGQREITVDLWRGGGQLMTAQSVDRLLILELLCFACCCCCYLTSRSSVPCPSASAAGGERPSRRGAAAAHSRLQLGRGEWTQGKRAARRGAQRSGKARLIQTNQLQAAEWPSALLLTGPCALCFLCVCPPFFFIFFFPFV